MLDPRRRKAFDAIVWTSSLLFAAVLPAVASGELQRYSNENPSYRAECGSCHVAYPPALLGADAWRTLMNGLDRHFGTDASIGDAGRQSLTAYLVASAGPRAQGGSLRITEARWFGKEHRGASAAWRTGAAKSAADCEACHPQAAAGDFSEDRVRVPGEVRR